MAFQSFLATMTMKEKQVLGSIDYYYESKSACEKNKDAGDLETSPTESNCERSKQAGLDSLDDDADELTEEAIALTEADLKMFKQEQVSPHERAHAHAAIAIGTLCGTFSIIAHDAPLQTQTIHTAMTSQLNQLISWQSAMQNMVVQGTSEWHTNNTC